MASERTARWTTEDLDFSRIEVDQVRAEENLFYLATCASFVESGSDLYAHNLTDFFHGDDEVAAWLGNHWEPEELEHGRALRAYVRHVWPEFDWDGAYRGFLEEYATYCKVELLAPTRALELAARCVVETGTATLYGALSRSSAEPVFKGLAARIAADEISHYKHFYRFFRRYRDEEGLGRARVLGVIARRTMEMKSEDTECAVRHVAKMREPDRAGEAGDSPYVRRVSARMNDTVRTHLSARTTLKMLMRPLDLPARLQAVVRYPVQQFMEHVFLR